VHRQRQNLKAPHSPAAGLSELMAGSKNQADEMSEVVKGNMVMMISWV